MIRANLLYAGVLGSALLVTTPAAAQTAATDQPSAADESIGGGDGDIVVTARKRDETAIAVPVVLTAVGAADIQRPARSPA